MLESLQKPVLKVLPYILVLYREILQTIPCSGTMQIAHLKTHSRHGQLQNRSATLNAE